MDKILDDMAEVPTQYSREDVIKLAARAANFLEAVPENYLKDWSSSRRIDDTRPDSMWYFAPVLDQHLVKTIPGQSNEAQRREQEPILGKAVARRLFPPLPQLDLIMFKKGYFGLVPVSIIRPYRERNEWNNLNLRFKTLHDLRALLREGQMPPHWHPLYLHERNLAPKEHSFTTPQSFFENTLQIFKRRGGLTDDLSEVMPSPVIAAEPAGKAGSFRQANQVARADAKAVEETRDLISQLEDRPWKPSSYTYVV